MLPTIHTRDDFQKVKKDRDLVGTACQSICAHHGIEHELAEPFRGGSLIVIPLGEDLVLKLYSPLFPDDMLRERLVMRHISGRLQVPTPEVQFSGHMDGWPYLIMDRLKGNPLEDVRDQIPDAKMIDLCREAGQILHQIHQLPTENLEEITSDWFAFRASQTDNAVAHQRDKGLKEDWLLSLGDFLGNIPWRPEGSWKPALLHTEIMADHLLVSPKPWRVSGLIDFEPSMVGDPEYDFASAILFVTGADVERQKAFFEGYGMSQGARTSAFRKRIMGYILLHVYSNLPWYFQFMPLPEEPDMHALVKLWMP